MAGGKNILVDKLSTMKCEEFIFSDWSPPDNPIKSERAKRASSSIMECEEFILPDWSPPDDPARVLAAEGRRNPSICNHKQCLCKIFQLWVKCLIVNKLFVLLLVELVRKEQ